MAMDCNPPCERITASPRCANGTGISRSLCSSAIHSASSTTLDAPASLITARAPCGSEYFFSRSVEATSTPVITWMASQAKRQQSCTPHSNGRLLRSSRNSESRVGQSGNRFIALYPSLSSEWINPWVRPCEARILQACRAGVARRVFRALRARPAPHDRNLLDGGHEIETGVAGKIDHLVHGDVAAFDDAVQIEQAVFRTDRNHAGVRLVVG